MQSSLCNQFTRIGLDGENSSVDGFRCYQHSAAVQHHFCELLCDYFNAIKALLLLNTVLISTTLIKNRFIHHWLTVQYGDVHFTWWLYISNWGYQRRETPAQGSPVGMIISTNDWQRVGRLQRSLGQMIVLELGDWLSGTQKGLWWLHHVSAGRRKKSH